MEFMTSYPESGSNNRYVVLENGELYSKLYSTYDAARAAVLHKHADTLEEHEQNAPNGIGPCRLRLMSRRTGKQARPPFT
jgi:hypothetical protein